MKQALLFLAFSIAAFGQTMAVTTTCNAAASCTPTTMDLYVNQFYAYPAWFSQTLNQQINITGTGGATWSRTLSGALSTACPAAYGYCVNTTGSYDSTVVTSGGVPATLKLNITFLTSDLTAGDYSGTITFDCLSSCSTPDIVITVTLHVAAQQAKPVASNLPGYPVGCSTTLNSIPDYCATAITGPTTSSGTCVTVNDTVMGGSYKQLTPIGNRAEGDGNQVFSATGAYVMVQKLAGGGTQIYRVSDCTIVWVDAPGNQSQSWWSTTDDDKYYYISGTQVLQATVSTTTGGVVLGDFASYGFSAIQTGGSQRNPDNWVGLYDTVVSSPFVAVNIPQLIVDGAPASTNTYVGTASGIAFLDWVSVTEVDAVVGKRFYIVMANPHAIIYTIESGGVLTEWLQGATLPGVGGNSDIAPITASDTYPLSASTGSHSSPYQAADGTIHLALGSYAGINAVNYYFDMRVSDGFVMSQSATGGHALYAVGFDVYGYANPLDSQPQCNTVLHGCIFANNWLNPKAAVIGASTNGATPRITVTGGHGYTSGTHTILVQQAAGGNFATCLTGLLSATYVSSTQLDVTPVVTCTGTYTADSGVFGDAEVAYPAAPPPGYGQMNFVKFGSNPYIRQLPMPRSAYWQDVASKNISGYRSSPAAKLSNSGDMFVFNSNMGNLTDNAVFVGSTGLGVPNVVMQSGAVSRAGAVR